ncbi:MAG TPA: tRNA uridine-5-carboxymethylaminomethyl(34) synthesis enzyme MnmG [Bacillota bacterium]|nr:tRNA uridine-5-carboxymethylaminomethyl(34) synthesis enzyme MnmG [Bacillota bacterium]
MNYDVIVVGAGHAGCEAALAAARLGSKTLLITISPDTIAAMSCNPAIGGPAAKSHLVRELDALGGAMAKVIDKTYLNIRTINETRGPAVSALRAQADKRLYQAEMTLQIERQPNLELKQGLVTDLLVEDGWIRGVQLKSGRKYFCKALVLATGTFLGGQIVMGNIKYSGGRQGEPAADELSDSLVKHGLKLRRFQTATPPRISSRSVDYSKISAQPLIELEWGFSWNGLSENRKQQPCWVTATTKKTIEFIAANLNLSPIKTGTVTGKGPRFCPSIDRKVLKFPSKTDHLIFIEPEGQYTEEMYLLGLTTAMLEEVQEKIIQTIPGLENAEIIRPGYAVEYDCLDSYQFSASLESKVITNLFTAGQINGTSGYEEAAVQGIIAGINASRKINGLPPVILSRTNSYIGVLIDDLVTKETEEPYRMMTSLAEYRIFLRLDNSLHRLHNIGKQIGILSDEEIAQREGLIKQAEQFKNFCETTKIRPDSELLNLLGIKNANRGYRLKELILRPEMTEDLLLTAFPELKAIPLPIRQYIWNEYKLEGYLQRQIKQLNEDLYKESFSIPEQFDYDQIKGMSSSAKKLLNLVKPSNIGQALRIPDITDSDKALLMMYFRFEGEKSFNNGISS